MLRTLAVASLLTLVLVSAAGADAPRVPPPPTTAVVPPPPEDPPPPVTTTEPTPPDPIIMRVEPTPPTVVVEQAQPLPQPQQTVYMAQPRDPGHWERSGPEWTASWVMLGLTAVTSIAAILVWNDGLGHFHQLQDLCASPSGCTSTDIANSSAHTSNDWTNALLGVSIGLGALTIMTFVIEGVVSSNRLRFVRGDASRGGVQFGLGPFGASISGTF